MIKVATGPQMIALTPPGREPYIIRDEREAWYFVFAILEAYKVAFNVKTT